MIKIILLILFLSQSFLFAQGESSLKNEKILNLVNRFLNLIKKSDVENIKGILADDIKIKYIAGKDLQILTDKFMEEKISLMYYVKKVTGNNIYKILYRYTHRNEKERLKVEDYEIIKDVGTETKITKEEINDDFYYVRVKITFKKLLYKGDTETPYKSLSEKKMVEVNILPVGDNEYRVFGFK